MYIINAMFGRGLGGIEQVFADYSIAMLSEGNQVTAIVQPDAAILAQIAEIPHLGIKQISNWGQWDFIATSKLRAFLKKEQPDAVIAHGNRAIILLKKAARNICPVIGIAHNYSIRHLVGLDAVFTITRDLQTKVIQLGQPTERVFHIPNMIKVIEKPVRSRKNPVVIGAMGRLVKKKGFNVFIKALGNLHDSGVVFRAVLGGTGEEEKNLKTLVKKLGLQNTISFCGWIKDKEEFFKSIDIFCLPSLHEPFGIVLLEAFANYIPVITTDSEGPSEIATHNHNAVLVPKENVEAMADALETLIISPQKAENLAKNAFCTVKEIYDITIISKRIQATLHELLAR